MQRRAAFYCLLVQVQTAGRAQTATGENPSLVLHALYLGLCLQLSPNFFHPY